jgi:hypothetical protein
MLAAMLAALIGAGSRDGLAQTAPELISSTASHGKLCIDVPGGLFQEGLPVRLFDCHKAENQLFSYDPRSKLLRVGGLCLNVFAGPLPRPIQSNDQVGLLGCDGSVAQQWVPARCDGQGHCTPYSGPEPAQISIGGLCLNGPRDGRAGRDLTVDRCADGQDQLWQFLAR